MQANIAAGTVAGAVVVVGCWLLNIPFPHEHVPPAVVTALTTIITCLIASVFPDKLGRPQAKLAKLGRPQARQSRSRAPPRSKSSATTPLITPPSDDQAQFGNTLGREPEKVTSNRSRTSGG